MKQMFFHLDRIVFGTVPSLESVGTALECSKIFCVELRTALAIHASRLQRVA